MPRKTKPRRVDPALKRHKETLKRKTHEIADRTVENARKAGVSETALKRSASKIGGKGYKIKPKK